MFLNLFSFLIFSKICDTLWKCLAGSVNIQVVSGWTVNNKHVYVNLCFGRKKVKMYSWQVKCANFLVPQPKFLTLELIGTSDLISKQADSGIAIKICPSSCLLKKCTISTIKRERRKAYGKVQEVATLFAEFFDGGNIVVVGAFSNDNKKCVLLTILVPCMEV